LVPGASSALVSIQPSRGNGVDSGVGLKEIFSSTMSLLALQNITLVFFHSTMLGNVDDSRLSMAA
jgi:hypothetical protein